MPAEQREKAREYICQVCGTLYGTMTTSPVTGRLVMAKEHIDHLIPRRWLEDMGVDPHQYANLLSVCSVCHGKKKAIEDRFFGGDFIAWSFGLRTIGFPISQIIRFAEHNGMKDFARRLSFAAAVQT